MTDLGRLLGPRHVALIGSTAQDSGLGARTLRHLRDGEFGGEITVARSAEGLPAGVDVAVVAVPAAAAPGVVAGACERAAFVIVYSSGFAEIGAAPLVRPAGTTARIIGPNSIGLYYGPTRAALTFAAAFDDIRPGPWRSGVFLVSQSGAFGARLVRYARAYGVSFDGFAGTGNEADYGACALAADLVESPEHRPRVIALYLESVPDGAALAGMLAAAAAHRVSVVVLLGGRSESGSRAAQSHTAAVSPGHAVVAELCALHGAVLVRSDRELAEAAIGLSLAGRARGPRLAVVTGSGGAGVIAADILTRRGLPLPQLSTALQGRLAGRLPAYASVTNPVDVTAQSIGDTATLAAVTADITDSGEADMVLVIGRIEQAPQLSAAARPGVPVIVCALDADPASVAPSIQAGLVMLPGLEAACNVARAAGAGWGATPGAIPGTALDSGPAAAPDPAPPGAPAPDTATPDTAAPDTAASLRLVAAAGVPVAPWRLARSPAEAAAAGAALGWPVVIKANLAAGAHKALRGGVRLDVGPAEAERAAAELLRLAPELVVARQLRGGPELLAGVRRDPLSGLTVVAGLGGGHAELISRVVSMPAAAPAGWLARRLASEVFDRGGARYAALPALLAQVAAALAGFAASAGLSLAECNPLVLVSDRLVALDARVITAE